MRGNSKILAAGMAINMPAIADPMKNEAYERERKKAEEEKKERSVEQGNVTAQQKLANETAQNYNKKYDPVARTEKKVMLI